MTVFIAHIWSVGRVIAFEADTDSHGGYAVLNNGYRFKVSRGYVEAFHCTTDYRFASAVQKRNRRRKRGAEKAKGTNDYSLGSSTINRAPLPNSDSHWTVPFIASTIFLTMLNPSPVLCSPPVGCAERRANL